MNRVLIIEDEIVTAEAVKEALALDDISADIASDGKIGLEKFISNNYEEIGEYWNRRLHQQRAKS